MDAYQNVAVAFAGFCVGGEDPVSPMAQKSQQDAMIEIFLPHGSIADTDGFLQIRREHAFGSGGISGRKSFTESVQHRCILSGFFLKPGQDLFRKDRPDFLIGNHQFISIQSSLSFFRQIAGGEEDAPQVIRAVIQLPVRQFLADLFCDRQAVYQLIQILHRLARGFLEKGPEDGVAWNSSRRLWAGPPGRNGAGIHS